LFQINIFLVNLDHFDALMSRNIFLVLNDKIRKKNQFRKLAKINPTKNNK